MQRRAITVILRQMQFGGPAVDAAGARIHGQRTAREHARQRLRGPSQQCAHAGAEFVQRAGLHQIVIGTGVERADAIIDLVARGQYQDRRTPAAMAKPLQHAQSIQLRQHQIQHDRVIFMGIEKAHRGDTIGGMIHRIPFP